MSDFPNVCVYSIIKIRICSTQYEEAKSELSDLQERYEKTEQEKESITDELHECKAVVDDLQAKGTKVRAALPVFSLT